MDSVFGWWQGALADVLANPWASLALVMLVSIVAMSDFYRRFQNSIGQAPRLAPLSGSSSAATESGLTVSVIIPAYNESVNIEDCMKAVLANAVPEGCELQLIVADDESTDDTRSLADRIAESDARSLVVTVPPRPTDKTWRGKNWACYCAVQKATGDYLLFVDADVRLGEDAIARALREAQTHQSDLLSCAPKIVCGCFSEWLVQPIMANLIAIGFDFEAVNDPSRLGVAIAAGPFMFFRRCAYDKLGGHAAVATDPVEDLALARLVKSSGLKLRYVLGLDTAKVRMYSSFGGLWEGWTKNYHLGSDRNIALTLVSSASVFLIFSMPWLGLVACLVGVLVGAGSLSGLMLSVLAVALQCVLRLQAARMVGQPFRYWWLGWLGGGIVSVIAIASAIKIETGWGWTWRGRSLADGT